MVQIETSAWSSGAIMMKVVVAIVVAIVPPPRQRPQLHSVSHHLSVSTTDPSRHVPGPLIAIGLEEQKQVIVQ